MEKNRTSRSEKIIESKKRKARNTSIWEASAYSVSDGFGLRNIAPYAIALNASNSMIGLLTSIPSLLGNLSQLFTTAILRRYSRKKLVVFAVFLQTIFWLMLLIPGILFINSKATSNFPMIIFLALYTGLTLSGALAGPAWTSWMRDIVPGDQLGRYFAKRNKIAGTIAFICMIIAGLLLDYLKSIEVLYGFFILFFFSFLFRGISGFLFTKQYEPKFNEKEGSYFSLYKFLSNMPFNNFGRFVLFIALINFSVAIASPFFAVYLLKDKGFNYTLYMALTMIMPIASILTMSYWGKISDSLGNIKVMKLTGAFICLVPIVYFMSSLTNNIFLTVLILLPIEILSGIGWSGFNLASSNFLLRTVTREKMVLCSSYMNVLNGFSIFLGAMLGGLIASINFWNPILMVFLISGFGRILTYLLVLPKVKEKVHIQSRYDKNGFISNFTLIPRFLYSLGEIVYLKKTIKNLKK